MSILDTILGRNIEPDNRHRNQVMPLRELNSRGAEVITVDPEEPLPNQRSRPPIIFKNG